MHESPFQNLSVCLSLSLLFPLHQCSCAMMEESNIQYVKQYMQLNLSLGLSGVKPDEYNICLRAVYVWVCTAATSSSCQRICFERVLLLFSLFLGVNRCSDLVLNRYEKKISMHTRPAANYPLVGSSNTIMCIKQAQLHNF